MVSNPKRMRYVSSENEFSSSEAEEFDDDYHQNNKKQRLTLENKNKSKTKWLSKNAIMARENRLKKKLYISNLEKEVGHLKSENSSFTKVIENQSIVISDLRKEIKYLKSVITNSKDIGKLLRNIHQSTGMSVTTSLDQTLSLNDYVSKPKQPIARKTPHPWEEKNITNYPSYPTPESDFLSNEFNDELLKTLELDEFLEVDGDSLVTNSVTSDRAHLQEHNYTSFEEDDVGVCLHVSKHRVSLEFCPSCSDNASQAWITSESL